MPPQDGDFLFRRVVRSPCRSVPASRCFRCFFMRSLHYLNGGTLSPFPSEPEQKENLVMRTVSAIARYLAGMIFLVFGLNGFLNFIPLPPPGGIAGQFMGACTPRIICG